MSLNIAVIGAGIMGLSTAYKVMKDIPNCKVTVFFDKCSPETTGNVAAGFIYPYPCGRPYADGQDEPKLFGWFEKTMDWLKVLYKNPDAYKMGINPVSGYIMGGAVPEYATKLFPDFREIDPKAQSAFMIPQQPGYTFTTWQCDCSKYLPWLMDQIKAMGGRFIRHHINAFSDLKDFDLIVNCTGINANFITNDKKMQPDRGQVIVVKAPWINHFYISGTDTYILPRMEEVVLGGTHQVGDYNLKENPEDTKKIWRECLKICPSLKYGEIKEVRVGLRPGRSAIRIEVEEMDLDGKTVPVLHNYGHGGAGVTFHWGCAIEASDALQTYLKKIKKTKNSSELSIKDIIPMVNAVTLSCQSKL
ncbi:D-aspartate oxidase-like [Clavelina lepadiformis]|uniref:D-aspartate oxidase-like n=1 Tax=Clavelina lepadiformis TaxID=159417 RepID=UPI0040437D17